MHRRFNELFACSNIQVSPFHNTMPTKQSLLHSPVNSRKGVVGHGSTAHSPQKTRKPVKGMPQIVHKHHDVGPQREYHTVFTLVSRVLERSIWQVELCRECPPPGLVRPMITRGGVTSLPLVSLPQMSDTLTHTQELRTGPWRLRRHRLYLRASPFIR